MAVGSAGPLVFSKMTRKQKQDKRVWRSQASSAFPYYSVSLNNLFGFLRLIRRAGMRKLERSSQPNEMQFDVIGGLRTQVAVSAFALQAK
jgi:hypothetical protein